MIRKKKKGKDYILFLGRTTKSSSKLSPKGITKTKTKQEHVRKETNKNILEQPCTTYGLGPNSFVKLDDAFKFNLIMKFICFLRVFISIQFI